MARTFGQKVRESVLKTGWSWGLYTPPDRVVLAKLMDDFARDSNVRDVLFVGVKQYNEPLREQFVAAGKMFATIEPNADMARFGGSPHYVDVLENLEKHVEPESFDLVVMNGVIGFGLNDAANVEKALTQVHRALRSERMLLLGINERIPTHVDLTHSAALRRFRPYPLPSFGTARHVVETPFREEIHAFELWQK